MHPRTSTVLALAAGISWPAAAQPTDPGRQAAARLTATLALPDSLRRPLTDAMALAFAEGKVRPAEERGRYSVLGCDNTEVGARLVDLNGDAVPEVHVQALGTCVGGMAGVYNWVFVRAPGMGTWRPNLTFNGFLQPLRSRAAGFADVVVGGPGFITPVWRWTGRRYSLYCRSGTGGDAPRNTCPRGLAGATAGDSLPAFAVDPRRHR